MNTKQTAAIAVTIGWLATVLCGSAAAQTSASFKLTENVINAGGNPLGGTRPTSASFRIPHDSIGDPAVRGLLSSASYRAEGGFVARYRPAGEAQGVRFMNQTTLVWDHEPSVGTYNLYRNTLASLPGNPAGCLQSTLAQPTFVETATPAVGSGWYYLVTAENRLGQEGTKGHRSNGAERPNSAPCP
jgi:hypothetical protein